LPYAQQLAAWQASRLQIKEVGSQAKENRKPESYRLSVHLGKGLDLMMYHNLTTLHTFILCPRVTFVAFA
jgi:hypothetical protein